MTEYVEDLDKASRNGSDIVDEHLGKPLLNFAVVAVATEDDIKTILHCIESLGKVRYITRSRGRITVVKDSVRTPRT